MGSLLSSLATASNAMRVHQSALGVAENNITNAKTPGYAKQRLSFEAMPFQPESGLIGGVGVGSRSSSRDLFLEQSVRARSSAYGASAQTSESLGRLESVLTVSENADIPNALNKLFQTFSALSLAPNDTSARQSVIDAADSFAGTINNAASTLEESSWQAGQEADQTVSQINSITARLESLNKVRRQTAGESQDAGVDAQVNALLEELSGLVDATVLNQTDGTVSVYVGGMTPLLLGESAYPLSASVSSSSTRILDSTGKDITDSISGGSLTALVEVRNSQIPGYLEGLNKLAMGVADQINAVLLGGLDASGAPPAVDLFTYNTAGDAARTLTVNAMTPGQLAVASATAPGGNGNALALADLASSPQIDGMTFSAYYGSVAGQLGRDLAGAKESAETQQLLLDQAQALREETSGVSIDEEAARIIELQRGYEAMAQVVSILNEMTQTAIGMIR